MYIDRRMAGWCFYKKDHIGVVFLKVTALLQYEFPDHNVYSLKVYSLVVFGIFTKLCIDHNHLISEHFHLQKNPILISIHSFPYFSKLLVAAGTIYNIHALRVPFFITTCYQYLLLVLIRAILVGIGGVTHCVYGMYFLND